MAEQADFKSMRITLSEEAFDRLESIMKDGKFRSYSSTVEECIRATYDVMRDIYDVIGTRDSQGGAITNEMRYDAFTRIVTRMSRFTGVRIVQRRKSK